MDYGNDESNISNNDVVGMNLFENKITVYWQVKGSDGVWKTWHTTGWGNLDDEGVIKTAQFCNDDGDCIDIPYIDVKRENVTETEQHRVYAIFGTCEYRPWENCNKIIYLHDCNLPEDDDLGDYDTECTITVGTNAGTLKIGKDEGSNPKIDQTSVNICYGEEVALELTGAVVPAGARLVWQTSANGTSGWTDVTTMSGVLVRHVNPGVSENDAYVGKTVYYRTVMKEGTTLVSGSETTPVSVTVKAARKVYIGWENQDGAWRKSLVAGYCNGDQIITMPLNTRGGAKSTRYTSLPTGVEAYYYQDAPNVSGFFGKPTSGSTTSNTKTYTPTSTRYYRIATKNGECYAYSDTTQIKINLAINVGITPEEQTLCVGADGAEATLRATGDKLDSYTWFYVANEDEDFGYEAPTTSDSYTRKYPIYSGAVDNLVSVIGYKIYGDKTTGLPQDTIHCPFYDEELSAVVHTKSKPTFTATISDPGALCAGTTSGSNGVRATVTPNPAASTTNKYTYKWYKDGVEQTSVTGNFYQIVPANTAAATTHEGTYKVKIVLDNGCPSDTVEKTATFTVNPVPTKPVVTMGAEQTACAGSSATLTATVANNTTAGYTYKYTWKTSAGANVHASYTDMSTYKDLVFGGSGNPSLPAAGNHEYYLSVTVTTNTTPACEATSDVPATKGKLTVMTCAGPSADPISVCPEADLKSFKLMCPSGADAISFTLSDGSTVAGTVSPSPSSSVNEYTLTPSTKPTATTTYKVTVTLNNTALDPVTLTYTILPTPQITVSVNSVSVCPGADVTFTATPSPSNLMDYNYEWTGRKNAWSTGTTNNIKFKADADSAGAYTVKVTAKSTQGCIGTGTGSGTLTVKPLPTKPNIGTVPDTTFCAGSDYTFSIPVTGDDESGVAYKYTWQGSVGNNGTFGNINVPSSKTLTICKQGSTSCSNGTIMPANGNWGLRLTITATKDGCSVDTVGPVVNAKVAAMPVVSPTGNNVTVCAGTDTTLSINYTPGAGETVTGYAWKLSNSTVATTETYKVTATTTTEYTVEVTVKNASGCITTGDTKVKITVNPLPSVSNPRITATKDKLCTNESINLTASATVAVGTLSSCRWYKSRITDTSASNRIAGANSATYTKANPATTDGGWYTAVLTYNYNRGRERSYRGAETGHHQRRYHAYAQPGLHLYR